MRSSSNGRYRSPNKIVKFSISNSQEENIGYSGSNPNFNKDLKDSVYKNIKSTSK